MAFDYMNEKHSNLFLLVESIGWNSDLMIVERYPWGLLVEGVYAEKR